MRASRLTETNRTRKIENKIGELTNWKIKFNRGEKKETLKFKKKKKKNLS